MTRLISGALAPGGGHVSCASEVLRLKIAEGTTRAREARTRAVEAEGRAARLKATARSARRSREARRRPSGDPPAASSN
jgi:hypothetical protein